MHEQFLHYIWFGRLFLPEQQTKDGERVEIIALGHLNRQAGPDVFNASLRIGETLWAGNVEFHVRASDWLRHGHELDANYDSVVLHVVLIDDADVYRTNGTKVAQLKIAYPPSLERSYIALQKTNAFVPCGKQLLDVNSNLLEQGLDRLLTERLEQKSHTIDGLLAENNQHWEEAFYTVLGRSFGFGVNSDAFERLTKSLPQTILGKHKDTLSQIEALLFGQAGWLTEVKTDDIYAFGLQQEYQFLRKKYGLTPLDKAQWRLLRMRPPNFPTIRLAQFAALIHRANKLFSKTIEQRNYKALTALFSVEPSDYWRNHYLFGEESPPRSKRLSRSSIDLLIINTVVPFLFAYGIRRNQNNYIKRAYSLLRAIKAEKNHISDGFAKLGIVPTSASDSQALIQLKTQYCDSNRCLHCPVGIEFYTSSPFGEK